VAQPNFAFGQAPPPAKSPFDFGQLSQPQRTAPAQQPFNFGQPTAPPPPPSPPQQSPFSFGQPANRPAPQPAFGYGQPPPPRPGAAFGGPAPNPFAATDLGSSAGGHYGGGYGGGAAVNPYASPAAIADRPIGGTGAKDIHYTKVEAGPILNWTLKVWQNNLGMLLGVSFIYVVVLMGLQIGSQFAQMALAISGELSVFLPAMIVIWLVNTACQVFLNIGMTQICLKLARQQRADFVDLFGGGAKFLPVFGFYLLVLFGSIAVGALIGFLAGILISATRDASTAPLIFLSLGGMGLFLFLCLFLVFWPIQTILIDTRIKFGKAFDVAGKLTQGNRLTGFVLILLVFGLGVLACILPITVMLVGGQQGSLAIMFMSMAIGGLEALLIIPLVIMLWAVAYLMMSGQISQRPEVQKTAYR
jgi:hypothetical protein